MIAWFKPFRKADRVTCPKGIATPWSVNVHDDCLEYKGAFALYDMGGSILMQLYGRVVEWGCFPTDVYVFNPPLALRQHQHGRCLQLLSPNSRWFKLHWAKPARFFDEARAYMEQLLSEVYMQGRGPGP